MISVANKSESRRWNIDDQQRGWQEGPHERPFSFHRVGQKNMIFSEVGMDSSGSFQSKEIEASSTTDGFLKTYDLEMGVKD
jgi:hypothetical protein